jgi:hypothetical protein
MGRNWRVDPGTHWEITTRALIAGGIVKKTMSRAIAHTRAIHTYGLAACPRALNERKAQTRGVFPGRRINELPRLPPPRLPPSSLWSACNFRRSPPVAVTRLSTIQNPPAYPVHAYVHQPTTIHVRLSEI